MSRSRVLTGRLLIFAPNWLGDAVMALPAIENVRRAWTGGAVDVVARPAIAPLFSMVEGIASTLTTDRGEGGADPLRDRNYSTALFLPNSFNAARTAWRAGIPERWGYQADFRTLLLTRSVARPARVHQAEYYRQLVVGLGFPGDHVAPSLRIPPDKDAAAAELLTLQGWDGRVPLVALAPGAAYGGAKKWPAASFARLAERLGTDGVQSVIVGSRDDEAAANEVVNGLSRLDRGIGPLNLVGRTDLPSLAAVLRRCRALVTNDSGAMHLAAALGVSVTALFGPTDERETHPVGPGKHTVLTNPVWCRPCMLRECPLTHRCMRGISANSAITATRAFL